MAKKIISLIVNFNESGGKKTFLVNKSLECKLWFSSTSFPGSLVLGEIPGRSCEEAKAKFASKSTSNIR